MNELAKWVWIILLSVLFWGEYVFWFILAEIILILLVWWLKPEWLDKL